VGGEEVRPAQLVSPPGAAGRFLEPSSRGHAPDPLTILTPHGLTLPRCKRQRVYKRPALVAPFVLGPYQGPDQTERCSTRRSHGYDRFPRRPCRRTGPACALFAEALLHNTPLPNRKGAEAVKLSRARRPLSGSTTLGTNRSGHTRDAPARAVHEQRNRPRQTHSPIHLATAPPLEPPARK